MKNIWTAIMTIMLVLFVYRLWFSDGSISNIYILEQYHQHLQTQIAEQKAHNKQLRRQVDSIKNDLNAVEEHARRELMMIRDDEYLFVPQITISSDAVSTNK